MIGISPSTLSFWLYKARLEDRYIEYTIDKKRGGKRHIVAPQGAFKFIQSKLAILLSDIYNDLEQSRAKGRFFENETARCVMSHGFKQGYSIITNAEVHRGRRFVFNADIENFFPSINFGRVRGFFINDRDFQLSTATATVIAQIVCYKNQLPQGSPCSPVVSNLIAHVLDVKLRSMASKGNCSYTRYVDDLTFSTNELVFPSAVARLIPGTRDRWVAGDGLLSRVYASGFKINHDKSRMQLGMSRQEATGLVVNQRVNVPAEYYKTTRAMCDRLFRHGYSHAIVGGNWVEVPANELQGRMDFIHAVRRSRVRPTLDNVSAKDRQKAFRDRENAFQVDQPAFSAIYRNLLNYRSFHGIDKPVLAGEGVTDSLYINAAIRTLGALFPQLYDTTGDRVLIDFYKHTEKRKFYQIDDGAPGLQRFVCDYQRLMSPFLLTPQNPVIAIFDRDDEGKKSLKAICNRYGQVFDLKRPFYNVFGNLYVMLIPSTHKSDLAIEDLFDAAVLSETLNGKSFSKSNNFNPATHYGKVDFAGKVIRPKRLSINWEGFEPLLKGLEEIILDYKSKV